MFVYTQGQPIRTLPLRTRIFLGILILVVLALIFVFGFAALIITLVGGLLTFVASLFARRPGGNDGPFPSSPRKEHTGDPDVTITFHPPGQHRRPEDDNVIDL